MADITKCEGKFCEERMQCYRYTASSGMRQSWSTFDSLREDGVPCEYMLIKEQIEWLKKVAEKKKIDKMVGQVKSAATKAIHKVAEEHKEAFEKLAENEE